MADFRIVFISHILVTFKIIDVFIHYGATVKLLNYRSTVARNYFVSKIRSLRKKLTRRHYELQSAQCFDEYKLEQFVSDDIMVVVCLYRVFRTFEK